VQHVRLDISLWEKAFFVYNTHNGRLMLQVGFDLIFHYNSSGTNDSNFKSNLYDPTNEMQKRKKNEMTT
jgi:hypothetical protein